MSGHPRPGAAPARPTMVDVARLAGVAVSTVSRVANGDPRVGDLLAARVRTAIEDLGWESDDRARHLRLGSSGILGAAVASLRSGFLHEVELAARGAGLMVVATSTGNDAAAEDEAVRSLCRRRVDGLVLEPGGHRAGTYLREQMARGMPVVAIDRPLPGNHCDSVVSDNRSGIRSAFAALVDAGHRDIGYLGDTERLWTGRERAAQARREITALGQAPGDRVFSGGWSGERLSEALARVLAVRPRVTALVSGNNEISTGLFGLLGADLGGLGFVGFDEFPLAVVLDPRPAVVAQDVAAMGAAAVQMLTSRFTGRDLPVRRRVVPVSLVGAPSPRTRTAPSTAGRGGQR